MPSAKLPKDAVLEKFIHDTIRQNAKESNGEVTLSIRQIRAALSERFKVDDVVLKQSKKDLIKSAAQDAIDALADEKTEQTEPEERNDSVEESDGQDESKSKSPSLAAESEMSELEDTDTEGASTSRTKKPSTKNKKTKASTSSLGKGSTGAAKKPRALTSSSKSSDKAEDEVTRLKKFVTACGVRKQWKNWFASQIPAAETPQSQAKALRQLLSELGMDGRLSMDKAKKIKEQREFEEEMKAIGADLPAEGGDRARSKRRTTSGSQQRATKAEASSTEDDDERAEDREQSGGEEAGSDEDFEEVRPPKKAKFNASLAAFAAELNSDDE